MATEKQVKLVQMKQRMLGVRMSSTLSLTPMSHKKVQEWIRLLDLGINPQTGNPHKKPKKVADPSI